MGYQAAQKAASRIIERMDLQFEELKNKATGLEQQLTDISKRVTEINEQLKDIQQVVKYIREEVVSHA